MKAEIGFARDRSGDPNRTGFGALTERLVLVIRPESETEATMVSAFAKRMRLLHNDEYSSTLSIEEPAKTDDILPDKEAR